MKLNVNIEENFSVFELFLHGDSIPHFDVNNRTLRRKIDRLLEEELSYDDFHRYDLASPDGRGLYSWSFFDREASNLFYPKASDAEEVKEKLPDVLVEALEEIDDEGVQIS